MSKDNQRLFSVAETAAELGITRARVNQMIDAGIINAEKVGRSYVISADELEKARQRNKNPGRPPRNKAKIK